MSTALPSHEVLALAALYSIGAHGIMTLNDFKSIEGDIKLGIRSLPVQLGPDRAARLACVVMALPQFIVMLLLAHWGHTISALLIGVVLIAQIALMSVLVRDPRGRAPWYNATGISLYVTGMMIAAVAIRPEIGLAA
jgi:chlorophyll synthase